jgi:hypothetical protein
LNGCAASTKFELNLKNTIKTLADLVIQAEAFDSKNLLGSVITDLSQSALCALLIW